MKMPTSLQDLSSWRRPGAELGRCNVPARADDPSPLADALAALLTSEQRQMRADYARAVEEIDAKRASLEQLIQDLHGQAQTDPRQLTSLTAAQRNERVARESRKHIYRQFTDRLAALVSR